MAFCGKCGTKVEEGVKFCPVCGGQVAASAPQQEARTEQEGSAANQNGFSAKVSSLNNTADTTSEFDASDITQNKSMAVLAYLGPLCFIPMFAAKESKFARFHANQGLVLLIAAVALGIASAILNAIILAISWRLYFLTSIISWVVYIAIGILIILGIVNAANGKAKELPVIGKIKILK
ncbi:MAG: zinc-ribbon domain-containing protein [Clostridia bacterium]|nr:zinc-ribbon domain-containing protein [Clostridia bacterium]